MKKLKYVESLLKVIFQWLGVCFAFMGILGYVGILQPTANSRIQDSALLGICFLAVGFLFSAMGVLFGIIAKRKNRHDSELIANGMRVKGIVENVYLQKWIQYNQQSPYRIKYAYTYHGREYHRRSGLIWEKPNLTVGETIVVYANDFGDSAILL